jgi:hypothetical protein
MIQLEIFLFFMSCINFTCDIVSKTFVTFKFNKMILRFVFCFHIMWICSMKSFKMISIDRFFRHFMNVSKNNRWIFVYSRDLLCSWWISKFFRWCSITWSIDTCSRSCYLVYRLSSMWWCWIFWILLSDTSAVCRRWIAKWEAASWWEHRFWAICWWFRRNSKSYRERFVW